MPFRAYRRGQALGGVLAIAGAVAVAIAIAAILLDRREDTRVASETAEIARLVSLPPEHHQTVFDAVRGFLQAHTSHDINEEFFELRKARAFSTAVLAHHAGTRKDIVPMECASRSAMMQRVLQHMDYKTRRIALFDTNTNLKSHSFMEVLNPATNTWETQDPDYDIYWRHNATKERASVFDMAQSVETDLVPCGPQSCGWTKNSNRLRGYFDILVVTDKQAGTRRAVYASHAKPEGPFTHKGRRGTFCEIMAKRCKDGFDPAP